MSNPQKIVIVGANGGIGHRLLHILSENFSIIALVHHSDSNIRNIKNIQIVKIEDTNLSSIEELLNSDTVIIHCANSKNKENNIEFTQELLKTAQQKKCKLFVYLSSWVVYSDTKMNRNGYSEEQSLKISKLDAYALNKYRQEEIIKKELSSSQTKFIILRPSLVYGENQGAWFEQILSLIRKFPLSIKGKFLDLIHVDDLCEYIKILILNKESYNQVYNVGGEKIRSEDYFFTMGKIVGKKVKNIPQFLNWLLNKLPSSLWFLRENIILNSEKIIHRTDYLPQISFHEFIKGISRKDYYPKDYDEVKQAYLESYKSFTPICLGYSFKISKKKPKGALIHTNKLNKILHIEKNLVTVQSGVILSDLVYELDRHNLALETLPEYLYLSVGACITTPIHGSSNKYGSLADLVTKITYMKNGEILSINETDPNWNEMFFNDLKGIILLEITFKCVKSYFLKRTLEIIDDSTLEHIDSLWQSNYSVILQWYPNNKKAIVWKINLIEKFKNKNTVFFSFPRHAIPFWRASYLHKYLNQIGKSYLIQQTLKQSQLINNAKKFFRLKDNSTKDIEFILCKTSYAELIKLIKSEVENGNKTPFSVGIRYGGKSNLKNSPCYNNEVYFVEVLTSDPYWLDKLKIFSNTWKVDFHSGKYSLK
ncbi:MAG: hypothetical protein BGO10_00565 [Chlamydia sp. 32-24]|nr:MAG: hypothetical protein BGO10_00565 [Chlamydia sp. 32-24]